MKQIIDIQIAGLMKRLEERKIHVELTDAAKEQLVREGYDPAYGARPLKRTIQRRVLDPLALRVLEGDFGEGDTVVVDARRRRTDLREARSGAGVRSELMPWRSETLRASTRAAATAAANGRARRSGPSSLALVRRWRSLLLLGARAAVLPDAGRTADPLLASSRRS